MKNFTKLLVTTFFAFSLFSCNKSKDDTAPASASLVGKWTFDGIGVKTNIKTIEASSAEIKKIDPDANADLQKTTFEFKADGTVISTDEDGPETGKYVLDAAKKYVTITPDKKDPTTGKVEVSKLEIVALTSSKLSLGLQVMDKKDADGNFTTGNDDLDFVNFLFTLVVLQAKGIDPDKDADFAKAKSLQIVLIFKK